MVLYGPAFRGIYAEFIDMRRMRCHCHPARSLRVVQLVFTVARLRSSSRSYLSLVLHRNINSICQFLHALRLSDHLASKSIYLLIDKLKAKAA